MHFIHIVNEHFLQKLNMISNIRKLRFWHKWLGIFSAIFLLNLGITGFILDHREWGWLYYDALPAKYLSDEFVSGTTKHTMDIIKRSDSSNNSRLLYGGNRGLWWSDDHGSNWQNVVFCDREIMPMITSIVTDINGSFETLYVSTNDGIWRSYDCGKTFERFAFKYQFVNALTYDISTGGLIGVIDRTKVFQYETKHDTVKYLTIQPPDESEIPNSVTMSRFVHDLHFGRGIFSGIGSWLWSDIAGIAMGILAFSGVLFWLLPKHYAKKASRGNGISQKIRGRIYRWTWRIHAPVVGLLASIPIVYLGVTGIFIDHSKELRFWMKSIDVSRQYLPPVYQFRSLKGEIYGIVSYPENKNSLTIGTRYGIFDSNDSAQTWKYNHNIHTFAMGITRDTNMLSIKGMGGPDYIKKDGGEWKEKKKSSNMGHMSNCNKPITSWVSWFDIIDGLHSGLIIGSWWKWANDIFAIVASVLVLTGVVRWWRKKWL